MSDTKKKKSAPAGKLPERMLGTSEAAKKIGCTAREFPMRT